jgi:hypothetical protein
MIKYQLFPRSLGLNNDLKKLIDCFIAHDEEICSPKHSITSNGVLKILEQDLIALGYFVEKGKNNADKIKVPVLFGRNNKIDKYFDADAISGDRHTVLEVEAGRAYSNNQFLKDLFQACMMFEVNYLVIAVRNYYRGQEDFEKIFQFFDTLYINSRLTLPLKGIVLIGY